MGCCHSSLWGSCEIFSAIADKPVGADGNPVMLTVEVDLDDVLVLVSPSGDSCPGHDT